MTSYPVNTQYLESFISRYIQTNSSKISQLSTQVNSVTITVKDGGLFYVKNNMQILQKNDLLQQASGIMDTQKIDFLATQVTQAIQQNTPEDVWSRVSSTVSSVINQTNYLSIVQTTLDLQTLRIVVTGRLIVNDFAEIKQEITTRVLATNVLKAIIKASNGLLYLSDDTPTSPPSPSPSPPPLDIPLPAIIGLSALSSCAMLIILILAVRK